jgi:pimeloyl-ACP methyl ester carboxylesterase
VKLRIAVVAVAVLVLALLVNAFLVDRAERRVAAFAGGRVLELEGPDLNVREYGPRSDRAVVLLHGYSASIEWWEKVAPALAATGQRVIAIDLVGHGGSEAPRDADQYGATGQAAAGLTPTVIAGSGHSPMVETPDAFVAAVSDFIER